MSKHIATDQLSFLATVLKMPINLPQKCVVRRMIILYILRKQFQYDGAILNIPQVTFLC